MYSEYELEKNKSLYYGLIDNLSSITKYVDECIDNLEHSFVLFYEALSIDGVSVGGEKIRICCGKLNDGNMTIKNTIIPAIKEEIERINKQLVELNTVNDTGTTTSYSSNTSNNTTSSSGVKERLRNGNKNRNNENGNTIEIK